MPQTMIAAQMYTVRDFTKTPEGIAESIKKVKDIVGIFAKNNITKIR